MGKGSYDVPTIMNVLIAKILYLCILISVMLFRDVYSIIHNNAAANLSNVIIA